ncbi:heavy-metal-associated domain-containing protein [Neobacillus mesonae]|uniref:heavy-metal-associated domain-containing protein n=1 Tax=Neobacillus mesonae TaxID=1193713 RepID=UPI00203F03BE|nr:heavy-metal-associated domain-containing protein [Neobacillus mesonae]MCM3568616.1 heavy-metal-associated domain-containing protein [Neobacillus mesonae]
MAKAIYQLDPLTCPSCIKKIETTLNKTAGVESAKVLFSLSKVKVEFDGSKVNGKELEMKITKLGYPVLSSKVS